jgi:disulfide bond formation protein DsbB
MAAHIGAMHQPSVQLVALLSVLAAAAALAVAVGSEWWGGLVPCALCLLERWPYRIAIVLGLLALIVPTHIARWLLLLLAVAVACDAALAAVHVGVEFQWWPSPLPECAAPHFSGGSIAERLASMPARPAKPCDDPTFLIPGLPLSMAAMNLLYAVAFSAAVVMSLRRGRRRR